MTPLVLASASATRAKMLLDAGIPIEVAPSTVDEDEIKLDARRQNVEPAELAAVLADEKANEVAARIPGRLVLGADQVLALGDTWFDKPRDQADARAQMRALRGKTHTLISAAVLVRDDKILWRGHGRAVMTMRHFTDGFLDTYLAAEGDAVLWTVGGYRIEGLGAQLFERVEGDYFAILGLPLLDVLAALRREGGLQQ